MNNPSYYAIIPAEVRYDESLSLFERFIYCEITALSNAYGYCYANNEYFAGLYHKTPETISRAISRLEKKNYIKLEYVNTKGAIKKRLIYPLTQKSTVDENVNRTLDFFVNRTVDENVKQNNINNINNINNNKYIDETAERRSVNPEIEDFFETLWKMLKSNANDRKSKVSVKRKKELFKMGDRAVKAIEVYLQTQDENYMHRRDRFLNEIIDNYLDKTVSDFQKSDNRHSNPDNYDIKYCLE